MEEKKVQRKYNRLWTILNPGSFNFNFFGRSDGFTLVELLVVVSIIGILVSAALLILNPFTQVQKANDTKRKADFSQIQRALETHYHDLGRYPASDSSYRIVWNNSAVPWGTSWTPYMAILPKDPRSPQRTYVYFATQNGQSYLLYAYLERDKDKNGNPLDPQLCNRGDACVSLVTYGIPQNACGSGGVCNYGVSSSNLSP